MLTKSVLIFILAASTVVPLSSQAQSPAHSVLAIEPPLPFPANAAGYQWSTNALQVRSVLSTCLDIVLTSPFERRSFL
jgi:hypothetical protein